MGNQISSNTNNRAEVYYQYIKQLDTFIKNQILTLTNLKKKHQQMAFSWKGKEYDNFSAIIMQTIKDAAKELAELEELKEKLVAEANTLKLAEDKLKQAGK